MEQVLKSESGGIDEKIQRLLEREDAHRKIEAIRRTPLITAPKITKDVFSEAPLASQVLSGSYQFRESADVTNARQERVVQSLFAGQIVRGVVVSVRRRVGVLFRVAQMIDFDAHEAPNDMKLPESLFNVSVFLLCPLSELGESLSAQLSAEVLPRFTVGDQVKAIILSMDRPQSDLSASGVASFRTSRVPARQTKIQLGLDKSPFELDCSIGAMYDSPSSENGLLNRRIIDDSAFGNPYALPQMLSAYGLEEGGGFLPSRAVGLYSDGDSWEKLRDLQNRQWANELVSRGVMDYARKNDFENAIKCYNQVLVVIPLHVDALVARGAAYANQKRFSDAAADFAKALEIDPKHENAKKYLSAVQTKADDEKRKRKADGDRSAVSSSSSATTTATVMPSIPISTTAISSSSSLVLKSSGGDEKRSKKKKSKKEKKHKHKHKKEKKRHSSSSSSSSDSSSD